MTTSALSRKLQIKPGNRVLLLNAPEGYAASLDPLPEGATVATAARGRFDVVHLFARDSRDLARDAPKALKAVADGGVLWISYPKRSSGVETDLTRDIGWKVVEEAGWGGVAQVAIDEVWSALRFRPGAEIQRTAPARAQSAAAGAPGRARGAGTSNKEAQAPGVEAPPDLAQALAGQEEAAALWAKLAPSHRREYARWVEEAKRPETRARRVAQAVEMMATGQKDRNAKYRG